MLRVEGRESVQARALAAVAGIGSQLEPSAALRAVVAAAADLTGARYGALGLIGDAGTLSGFIPVGDGFRARSPRSGTGRRAAA